ncbi:MAG: hypothetical protein U0230_18150 [Polyangiales bacterium]
MAGPPTPDATERLARALAAHGAGFVDDREGATLDGVFRPRAGALSRERLRAVLRSWELFDRAYEPLPEEEAEALVTARLAGLALDVEDVERLAAGLVVFPDGIVLALESETLLRWLGRNGRA